MIRKKKTKPKPSLLTQRRKKLNQTSISRRKTAKSKNTRKGRSRLKSKNNKKLQIRSKFPKSLKFYIALPFLLIGIGLIQQGYKIYFKKDPDLISQSNSLDLNQNLVPEFLAARSMSLEERIAYWSEFLEKNGESQKKLAELVANHSIEDIAPLIPERYDCTTFVETVISLSRSEKPSDFIDHLLAIRYKDGHPGFIQRNHFPEADWIPNNIRAHILTDITAEVARDKSVSIDTETKKINRGKWLSSKIHSINLGRQLSSTRSESLDSIEVNLSYIPIQAILNMPKIIPHGTVINFVHKNNLNHPVLISHQGFVIHEGEKVLLRHASMGGQIRTVDLSSYLKEWKQRKATDAKWPLIGVNLNQIRASISANNLRSDAM